MSAGVALGAWGTSIFPYSGTISVTIAATRSAAGGAAASALRNSSTSLSSRILMAHDWTELFILDGGAPADAVAEEAEPERRRGFFRRLRENMSKTRAALGAEIQATLFETLDDETWERLEEALIMADVGARTTAQVVGKLEEEATSGGIEGGPALAARLTELLSGIPRPPSADEPRIDLRHDPAVIMVCG